MRRIIASLILGIPYDDERTTVQEPAETLRVTAIRYIGEDCRIDGIEHKCSAA